MKTLGYQSANNPNPIIQFLILKCRIQYLIKNRGMMKLLFSYLNLFMWTTDIDFIWDVMGANAHGHVG